MMIVINSISLFVIDMLFDGIYFSNTQSLFTTGFIFGCVNALLVPILKLVFFPLKLLTLGLFTIILNGIVLYITFQLSNGAYIAGLLTAIIAAIVLGVVNGLLNHFFNGDEKE